MYSSEGHRFEPQVGVGLRYLKQKMLLSQYAKLPVTLHELSQIHDDNKERDILSVLKKILLE